MSKENFKENPEQKYNYDLEKLKSSAVHVKEKNDKIILDSENKNDFDWLAE